MLMITSSSMESVLNSSLVLKLRLHLSLSAEVYVDHLHIMFLHADPSQAIQERIKKLNFQDCKVRISNVDSQASFENIVIQVIGETSNKAAEPKKFVQTFVLAQQPTGYFVLNDIFRYINEDVEEDQVAEEEAPAAPIVEDVEMPAQPTEEPAAPLDVETVDKKLDEVAESEPAVEAPATNGTSEVPSEPVVEQTKTEEVPTPEVAEKEVEEEEGGL